MSAPPIDQQARTRAIEAIDASIALSAGAGSGKTSVLASRVVSLLCAGRDPARVAAITFTEKAAGELEARVRDALEDRFRATGDTTLEQALSRFSELTISTIHGFCMELLRSEPLAARWAPDTELEPGELHGIAAALSQWRSAVGKGDSRTLALFDAKLKPGSVRDAIAAMIANRDLTPHAEADDLDWAIAHQELCAARDAIEAVAAECTAPSECKLLANNADFRNALAVWCADSERGAFDALLWEGKPGRSGGKKGDWPNDGVVRFKAALGEFDVEWRPRIFARAHALLVRTLRDVAVPAIIETRRREARADYDDLLFRAAALLREPLVRARVSSQWDALLIDEVQDTDPVQAEVAVLLSRAAHQEGAWGEHPPQPGRLFAVGDPKQSIYRFRRADVELWNALRALIERDGHADELSQNFRSVPGAVQWVNHVFADMPGYSPQHAHRAPASLDPVVVLAEAQESERLDAAAQAHALARHILDLQASGATVVDRTTGKPRALSFGDVMVLVPRWSGTNAIVRALEAAGITAVVDGGKTFFHDPVVKACVAALAAIDEPADTESTATALRGLFGFTLEDLARHVAAKGSLRFTVSEQPPGPVREALEQLNAARRLLYRIESFGSWVPVLDLLLHATRASAAWSLEQEGAAHLANLDKLRTLLRELEATSHSPSEVMRALRRKEKDKDEDELARLDPDSDVVRVTTVFSAKGLEAPVVALLDMDRSIVAPGWIAERDSARLHLKIGDFAPVDWAALVDAEKEALAAEQRRWMYVACTRARDQLVILAHPKARLLEHLEGGWDASDVAHDTLQELAEGVFVRVRQDAALPAPPERGRTFPSRDDAEVDALLAAPAGKGDAAGEARAREVAAQVRSATRASLRWRSVGQLVSRRRAGRGAKGVGTAGGVALHRTMEELDLSLPRAELQAAAPGVVEAHARDLGLSPELTARVVEVALELLANPILDEVRAAPEHWKEVPFAFHEGKRVIAGTIDLCFPEDEAKTSWVVVDWKSDLPAVGDPLRDSYEAQLALYAKALLATITPCEKVRTVLAGPHAQIPPAPDDESALDEVDDRVRPLLERLLALGAPVPAIGLDVGEPTVIGQLELAWEHAKVGVVLDVDTAALEKLRELGWTIEKWAPGEERPMLENLAGLLDIDISADEEPAAGSTDTGGEDE